MILVCVPLNNPVSTIDHIDKCSEVFKKKERGILQLSLYGDEVVNHEIHRASINTIPYFFVGATAMILLVFFAVLRYKQVISFVYVFNIK